MSAYMVFEAAGIENYEYIWIGLIIMADKIQVKVSVRGLVEFILRCGSLNSGFVGSSRAADGTKAHRKIQQQNKEAGYEAEVALKREIEFEDFILVVEGRADGILKDGDRVIIDEIKSTEAHLDTIDENYNMLHWAQAYCYAYIYAANEGLKEIGVRLIYYHLESDNVKEFTRKVTLEELKEFFNDLIEKYYVWAKLTLDWNINRDISIKNLEFPFKSY